MAWVSADKCVHNISSVDTGVATSVDIGVATVDDIPKKKTLVCAYNKGKTTMCDVSRALSVL